MDRDDVRAREALGTISRLFKEFKIGSLLNLSNINQTKGASPLEIFSIVFNLCFTGKNLFEGVIRNKAIRLNKRHIYGFLNNPFFNWRKLLFLFSIRIYQAFRDLTSNPDEEVLIVDDSTYDRSRSKFVELLAKVFDHYSNTFIKGFRCLTLGWSDGNSFLGLDFALLSSSQTENRYCEADGCIDKRSCGGIRRKEAVQKATELLPQMVNRALTLTRVRAKRLLLDSWFSYPKVINELLDHIDVICMVKNHANVYYRYNGRQYRLSQLYNALLKRRGRAVVKASVIVETKYGDPVRLVFVKADNARGWLALLSTDLLLEETEIIRLYGKRWDIEVFFKMCKQHLKLVKEVQLRNFDGLIAHTTVVMMRYNLLSYERRMNVDLRSYSDVFREFFDELANLSFIDALSRILMSAIEQIRKSKQLSESIIGSIFDIIMSSTIRYFNLGPRQPLLC
ncbi:MAG: transposase [Deltaproteobacteria bacterium]|nr:transposase [Deltaproteobacteria bacterium]